VRGGGGQGHRSAGTGRPPRCQVVQSPDTGDRHQSETFRDWARDSGDVGALPRAEAVAPHSAPMLSPRAEWHRFLDVSARSSPRPRLHGERLKIEAGLLW
jgi:hypothetical protein